MRRKIAIFAVAGIAMCSCSSIDCPLNNTVYAKYSLMNNSQQADTLSDTLTIWTHLAKTMTDTVLLNQQEKAASFSLPMSYAGEKDSLFIDLLGRDRTHVYDTIVVSKTNEPHFESTDCAPSFFHTVSSVWHSKNGIDSIIVADKHVTNDANATHFHIYFNPIH